ncbi:hypothetical protein EMGBS1_03060 [Chloroflexota bacterium]|nr:hypothetical protein EMGBS1_03060 [Chloroflexota bacterium]
MLESSLTGLLVLEPAILGTTAWELDTLRFTPSSRWYPAAAIQPGWRRGAAAYPGGQCCARRAPPSRSAIQKFYTCIQPIHRTKFSALMCRRMRGAGVQLTNTNGGIYDYAVARDGAQLVYAAQNARTGVDLWLLSRTGGVPRLLVACEIDRCIAPEWSPDGRRIAYSRENAGVAPGSAPGAPRLWTVDVETGETAAFNQDTKVLGFGATWSPDGKRLMVYDGSELALRVYEVCKRAPASGANANGHGGQLVAGRCAHAHHRL